MGKWQGGKLDGLNPGISDTKWPRKISQLRNRLEQFFLLATFPRESTLFPNAAFPPNEPFAWSLLNNVSSTAYRLFIILTFFCVVYPVEAQEAILSGRVVDATSNQPLPGVNVFIDQTLHGAATDRDGFFQIERLPVGSYKLVASMVGYVIETISVEVTPHTALYTIDFKLTPEVMELDEIQVEDRHARSWRRDFRRFERLFLGTSTNARSTRIENRFVIDFDTRDQVFIAHASEPLEIENRALGYRIRFVLTDFRMDYATNLLHMQGPFYFTELEPRSPREAARWRENRAQTFRGSLQHLLRSLIRNNHYTQGYTVQLDDRKNAPYSEEPAYLKSIEGLSVIEKTERAYLYRISFPDYLYVEYREEPSWLEMNRTEAKLHISGYVYSPAFAQGALTVYGALSKRRIADLLPRDYVVGEN